MRIRLFAIVVSAVSLITRIGGWPALAASLTSVSEAKIDFQTTEKFPVPSWGGGALLILDNKAADAPLIRLFDRQGQLLPSPISVAIPGATTVALYDASRGTNTGVAVCGLAIDKEGRRAPFLAIFSPAGAMTKLIRTESYHPYRIAVASDGTIWTQGVEALDNPPAGSTDPAGDVMKPYLNSGFIRRFDANGKLLGGFIPQASVKHMTDLMGGAGYLVTANNRVAWYGRKDQRYVEIGADGTVQDFPATHLPGSAAEVAGIALTDSGDAFAAVNYGDRREPQRGHVICILDRATRTWVPIRSEGSLVFLYGADGDVLVSRAEDWFTMRFLRFSR
jgi:hypothetical protein